METSKSPSPNSLLAFKARLWVPHAPTGTTLLERGLSPSLLCPQRNTAQVWCQRRWNSPRELLYIPSAEGLIDVTFIKNAPWLSKYGRCWVKSGLGAFKGELLRACADMRFGSPRVDQYMQCFLYLSDYGPFGSSNALFHGTHFGKC